MFILKILWFIIPAGIANGTPTFAMKIFPMLNQPVDCHKTFRGKRILGDHKTLRGLFTGTLMATLVFILQKLLYSRFQILRDISLLNYENANILIGSIVGFGALFGDMIKSFFKRQIGIKPGNSWFPFDQSDWLIGCLLFASPFFDLSILIIIGVLLIGITMHLISKLVGFITGIEKTPI
jgi:CDP-2,3-bis-(O-geranylgeranyl)-sn-glycerol synthase